MSTHTFASAAGVPIRNASRMGALACVLLACGAPPALAATLPNGFSEFAINGGNTITNGTSMEFSPDGKLFVLEQGGAIQVFDGSGATAWTQLQSDFFADTPLNVDSADERGLLGIAFDPDYMSNRFVYVYYTAPTPSPHNRIARYTANGNGDLALAGSARTIMNLDNLNAGNHNGGAMHFGPDGKLYVAVGENGHSANSQSIHNRLGKILRLNPNPNNPIPGDNPSHIAGIAGTTTGANRAIWCAGLRNPFTFAFKPGGAGTMYINDVGAQAFEEIDIGAAGANYGWGITEGPFSPMMFPNFTRPVAYYSHSNASQSFPHNPGFTGDAITGGAFYLPANETFPAGYHGDYFFADYISGWIRRYDRSARTVTKFASGISGPVSLLVGDDGALYYLARDAGMVMRVQRN